MGDSKTGGEGTDYGTVEEDQRGRPGGKMRRGPREAQLHPKDRQMLHDMYQELIRPKRGVVTARPQSYTLPQIPSPAVVVSKQAPAKTEAPKIIIKQTVKQIQKKEGVVRMKRVKKAGKDVVKKRRQEYNALKSKAKKQITAGKKAHYTRENIRIKKLPVKERVAERKRVKQQLKKKQMELLKKMPAAGRLKLADLVALISKVKTIKW